MQSWDTSPKFLKKMNIKKPQRKISTMFFFLWMLSFFYFIFNWRIIALQYYVGFCHTSTWISHRYTYVPSIVEPPPISHPQSPGLSSLSHTEYFYRLYILYMVVFCCAVCAQSCPALCNPMDYSSPGSFVHGIFQARIPEWVAISFSRWSSQTRDRTHVSYISCIGRQILYQWATGKSKM